VLAISEAYAATILSRARERLQELLGHPLQELGWEVTPLLRAHDEPSGLTRQREKG
jgi:hypothetical protein